MKNFKLDEVSISIFLQSSDEHFQTKSFIKRTCKGDDTIWGIRTYTSPFWNVESGVLAINSKPFFNEMKWNLTGRMRTFVWDFEGFMKGNSIGNLGNPIGTLKLPHKYSHTMGWTINPYILQLPIFSFAKIPFIKCFFWAARAVS
jgi:hypothetical protein